MGFSPVLSAVQLIESIASIIDSVILERDRVYKDTTEIPKKTEFHAKFLPPISICDYLKRFYMLTKCDPHTFVIALIYLDRIEEAKHEYVLDNFNALRLLFLSLLASLKFNQDFYYTNTYYAKVGGLSIEECNKLEKSYLVNLIKFDLVVNEETYNSYYFDVMAYHAAGEAENIEP